MYKIKKYSLLLGVAFFLLLFDACSHKPNNDNGHKPQAIDPLTAYYEKLKQLNNDSLVVYIKQDIDNSFEPALKEKVKKYCTLLLHDNKQLEAIAIAAYPYGMELSGTKDSEIGQRMLTSTLLPGRVAPLIKGIPLLIDKNNDAKLLLFYKSDCPACHSLIDDLKKNYHKLQDNGIRIISIAADEDKALFEEMSRDFPWEYKLYDGLAYRGNNFINYGIFATPTIWLIDTNGLVVNEYTNLVQTGLI